MDSAMPAVSRLEQVLAAASRGDVDGIVAQADAATVELYGADQLADWWRNLGEVGDMSLDEVVASSSTKAVIMATARNGRLFRIVCEVAATVDAGLLRLVWHPVEALIPFDGDVTPVVTCDGIAARTLDELVALVAHLRVSERLPGIVVAVRTEAGSATICVGFADLLGHEPVAADTVFRLSSLVKPLTATTVLRLVEGGLGLDDSAAAHISGIEVPEPITVRQLLTHTSGIARWSAPLHAEADAAIPTVVDYYRQNPLRFRDPARGFEYSNHNYAVLGQLVSEATGTNFDESITRLVTEPLGMVETSFHRNPPAATGYSNEAGAILAAAVADPILVPASGGWSTTTDLIRFASFVLEPEVTEVLRKATVNLMFTDQNPPRQTAPRGLGFALEHFKKTVIATHTGGWPGHSGCIGIAPSHNAAVAALTNISTEARDRLAPRLLEAIL